MHALSVAGIKFFRLIVPLAQKVLTPKQAPPPPPDATTYISSPQEPIAATAAQRQRSHGTSSSADSKVPLRGPTAGTATEQRMLKADIYLPSRSAEHGTSAPPSNAVLPIVINFHGSGFCFKAHGEDATFCSYLANTLPAVVVDVDYSHAPEHPWPAAVEDVDAAIAWARRFARLGRRCRQKFGLVSGVGGGGDNEWEWDERRIALTGFSAGGNLALVGSTRAQSNGGVQAVVAYYPSTNLAESPWDKPQLKPGSGAAGGALPPWLRYMLYECYIPASIVPDRKDPNVSPLYASPSLFPPSVTIITCEKDALAREGQQLAERLREASTGGGGGGSTSGRSSAMSEKAPRSSLSPSIGGGRTAGPDSYRGDVVQWTAKGQGHNWDKMCAQGSEPARMRDEAYRLTVRRIRDAFARVAVGFDEMREDDEEEEEDDGEDGRRSI